MVAMSNLGATIEMCGVHASSDSETDLSCCVALEHYPFVKKVRSPLMGGK